MNYSTILMGLIASQNRQLASQIRKSLEPYLQQVAELVTTFFTPRAVAEQRLGP